VGIVKVVAPAVVVAAGACALCCSPVARHALSTQQTTVASVVPSPPAAAPVAPPASPSAAPSALPVAGAQAIRAMPFHAVAHSATGMKLLDTGESALVVSRDVILRAGAGGVAPDPRFRSGIDACAMDVYAAAAAGERLWIAVTPHASLTSFGFDDVPPSQLLAWSSGAWRARWSSSRFWGADEIHTVGADRWLLLSSVHFTCNEIWDEGRLVHDCRGLPTAPESRLSVFDPSGAVAIPNLQIRDGSKGAADAQAEVAAALPTGEVFATLPCEDAWLCGASFRPGAQVGERFPLPVADKTRFTSVIAIDAVSPSDVLFVGRLGPVQDQESPYLARWDGHAATLIAAPFARGTWSVSHSRSGTRWLVVRTQHAGELWSLSSAGDFERVSLPEAFNPQAVWARDEQDVWVLGRAPSCGDLDETCDTTLYRSGGEASAQLEVRSTCP